MDHDLSDSSGTDDGGHLSNQILHRGIRISGNDKSAVSGSATFIRMQNDMETQIHLIEREAYCAVLRAFKAQSDAISWEKEGLLTELRNELRLSDGEHSELLMRVDSDDAIRRLREWRKTGGNVPMPNSNFSASRKKHKTLQDMPSLSGGAPSNFQPSSSSFKQRGPPSVGRGKKQKPYPSAGVTSRAPVINQSCFGGSLEIEDDPESLIGRKVWTRWPDDNNFYEAVISNYNEGCYSLVYDINTENETWETVNLKEINPEDILWEAPAMHNRGGRPGSGRGMKKSMGRGVGRGRGIGRPQPTKYFPPLQNGAANNHFPDIEILHTHTLISQVEKVLNSDNPDTSDIEKAKKVLKDHEQALMDAIGRLEEASDGESGEEQGGGKRVDARNDDEDDT